MSEQSKINLEQAFYVGEWRVEPDTGRISRENETHKIEPKAMTVLVCLARQQGQVVSRDSLEQQAWQGVVVGYDSLASAIIKLRKAFGDDSKSPSYIETIPKKGYRLLCPVSSKLQAESVSEIQQEIDQNKARVSQITTYRGRWLGFGTVSAVPAKAGCKLTATRRLKSSTEILFNVEIIVSIRMIFNVRLNHLVRDITRAARKIPSRPHSLAPVLLS